MKIERRLAKLQVDIKECEKMVASMNLRLKEFLDKKQNKNAL